MVSSPTAPPGLGDLLTPPFWYGTPCAVRAPLGHTLGEDSVPCSSSPSPLPRPPRLQDTWRYNLLGKHHVTGLYGVRRKSRTELLLLFLVYREWGPCSWFSIQEAGDKVDRFCWKVENTIWQEGLGLGVLCVCVCVCGVCGVCGVCVCVCN